MAVNIDFIEVSSRVVRVRLVVSAMFYITRALVVKATSYERNVSMFWFYRWHTSKRSSRWPFCYYAILVPRSKREEISSFVVGFFSPGGWFSCII
jgi:hypothetical protein